MNSNTQTLHETTAGRPSGRGPADLLWVSAFALAAVVIVQIGGRLGAGSPEPTVLADMVAHVGELSAMTTASSEDEELLYVLDNRNEQLLIYEIGQQRTLDLMDRQDLPSLFASARGLAGGR
ncbi:MAG: hypothetical protein AAGF47_00795 [Planctomycetota bacterium]